MGGGGSHPPPWLGRPCWGCMAPSPPGRAGEGAQVHPKPLSLQITEYLNAQETAKSARVSAGGWQVGVCWGA